MMVRITKDNWLILTDFIERLADRSHVVITPIRSGGKLLLWVSPTNRPYDGVTYPIRYKDGQYPSVKITYHDLKKIEELYLEDIPLETMKELSKLDNKVVVTVRKKAVRLLCRDCATR